MDFSWDDEKNKINIQKHGVSFESALGVFFDPNRLESIDFSHSNENEERYRVIGMSNKLLFVVYTERFTTYRIISARLADKEEQDEYYKINGITQCKPSSKVK